MEVVSLATNCAVQHDAEMGVFQRRRALSLVSQRVSASRDRKTDSVVEDFA
jgi:hypothetical protein